MSQPPKVQPKQQVLAAPSRMTLRALVKGRQVQPIRALLFGPEGVGKSTFGSNAPAPIFLGAEDGTGQLDVTRFPSPETWPEVLEAVRVLTVEPHDYRTVVLDSADWIEPLIWTHLCRQEGVSNIESLGGGYGKGYTAALDQWRLLLAGLEALRRAKSMHVVTLAHSVIKSFKNPEGLDYERYELKLNGKAAGLLKEWHDAVLFANHEAFAVKDEKTKRVKGVSTGARVIYTSRTAAYDAKNRYSLPDSLPLSWQEFESAVAAGRVADPSVLLAEIERKIDLLDEKLGKDARAAILRAAGDAQKLAQLNNWANVKLAEKAEKEVA